MSPRESSHRVPCRRVVRTFTAVLSQCQTTFMCNPGYSCLSNSLSTFAHVCEYVLGGCFVLSSVCCRPRRPAAVTVILTVSVARGIFWVTYSLGTYSSGNATSCSQCWAGKPMDTRLRGSSLPQCERTLHDWHDRALDRLLRQHDGADDTAVLRRLPLGLCMSQRHQPTADDDGVCHRHSHVRLPCRDATAHTDRYAIMCIPSLTWLSSVHRHTASMCCAVVRNGADPRSRHPRRTRRRSRQRLP